jgi:hypothetical protein
VKYLLLLQILFHLILIEVGQADRVVLLTSFSREPIAYGEVGEIKRIHRKAERLFRKRLASFNIELEVRHFADRFDLFEVSRDPEVIALLWVSHASVPDAEGGFQSPYLQDFQGFDVVDIFRDIPSTLRRVYLVACKSEEIIKEIELDSEGNQEEESPFFGFSKKVRVLKGMKKALTNLKSFLDLDPLPVEDRPRVPPSGLTLSLKRSCPGLAPAVAVMASGRVLGAFPKAPQEGSLLKMEVRLQNLSWPNRLVIDAGSNWSLTGNGIQLCTFEILADEAASEWTLFSKPNGEPFGRTKNIYIRRSVGF